MTLTLGGWLAQAASLDGRTIGDRQEAVAFSTLLRGEGAAQGRVDLSGKSVLIATRRQLAAARAMVALDGVARLMVLVPTDLGPAQLAEMMADAEIDACVVDADYPHRSAFGGLSVVDVSDLASLSASTTATPTEWVLTTSGTTSAPKLVVHTLDRLAGAIGHPGNADPSVVWSTFYDIRRYGGLQIFLRAIAGPSSLVLCDPDESVGAFLQRQADAGVSHILGTPSHWRRALMSPDFAKLKPRYVRLSGEIADQAILDRLRAAFPEIPVAHAYASTEGGVGFAVEDGQAGFPLSVLQSKDGVEFQIRDDVLYVRSPRTALLYLGSRAEPLVGPDGFVETGDVIEQRDGRCTFLGRRSGMINVGGAKVQPEEVEQVVNSHPDVSMCRVRSRRNPILGALVEAEIVLRAPQASPDDRAKLKTAILSHCRDRLAKHKVPATIAFVTALPVTEGGKLSRTSP